MNFLKIIWLVFILCQRTTYRQPKKEDLLYMAVNYGCYEGARNILEDGVNPNIPSKYGKTPLQAARHNNNRKMIQLLLSHGAQPAHFSPKTDIIP